jgi:uncharacterized protein (TIGR02001 family)
MHTSIRGLIAATLLAGTAVAATPAFADDAPAAPASPFTITGSAAIVSQYRFRGLSQSDNKPAVQASFTLAHSSGFYISTWGSSASAGDAPINIGGTEIDVYGGWTHAIGKSGVTFDGGVYGYIYPGATTGNYYEVYGSLTKTFGPATAKVGVNFAPAQRVFDFNFTSSSRSNTYIYGELGAGIPNTPISLHSHLGHTGGGFDWGKQYFDWVVGATVKWKALAFDVSWVGTNLSHKDIDQGFGCGNQEEDFVSASSFESDCTQRFYRMSKNVAVFSVSASF